MSPDLLRNTAEMMEMSIETNMFMLGFFDYVAQQHPEIAAEYGLDEGLKLVWDEKIPEFRTVLPPITVELCTKLRKAAEELEGNS